MKENKNNFPSFITWEVLGPTTSFHDQDEEQVHTTDAHTQPLKNLGRVQALNANVMNKK